MKLNALFIALLISSIGFSQNIKDQRVNFNYIQLPLKPFSEKNPNYEFEFISGFEAKNQDSTAAYEKRLEEAKIKREAQLAVWREEQIKNEKAYYAAMANYEKQLAAGNTTIQMPTAPQAASCPCVPDPEKPLLTPDITAIQKQKATIEGLNSGSDGVKATLTFKGFEQGLNVTGKVDDSGTEKTYTYTYQYKHPVHVKLQDSDGSILMDGLFNGTDNYSTQTTSSFGSKYDYLAWKVDQERPFLEQLQAKIVNQHIANISNYISEQHGFMKKQRSIEIYTAKNRRVNYDDLLEAYQEAKDGYLQLAQNKNDKTTAMKYITKAIGKWSKTLQESNVNDKNARINKKVTAAVYLNLAEAYLWMDDFSQAELYANKAKNLGIPKYNRHARRIISFIPTIKTRFEAN